VKSNFDRALARVLVYEGGISNNPNDPGGLTNRGITQGTYNSWLSRQQRPLRSVIGIQPNEVAAIYKTDYWDRIGGDDLPSGVDFCMFDAAVNSGVGGATKWAQAILSLTVDGDFGPKTLQAIVADDPEDFIKDFCAHRLGTLQRLPTWKHFGKGWAARIANVQKTSLAWANGTDNATAPKLTTVGGNAKAHAQDIPASSLSRLATHAGTMGGVIATGAAQAGQALAPASDALAYVKYAVAGLTVIGAVAGLMIYMSKVANDAASNATRRAEVNVDADAEVESAPVLLAPTAENAHG
jgi:lysozyme family protein